MRPPELFAMGALLFSLIVFAACESRSAFIGKYTAEEDESGAVPAVVLELKGAGQGSWATEDESVPFRWDSRGDEIRLHTRAGGIVQGKVLGGAIAMSLPGVGQVQFQRTGY